MFSLLLFFSFHLFYFNPLTLKNNSNKLSSSWIFCNSFPYMHLFWGFFQICLDGLLRPLHFLIHVNPSPIFARDPHVVTDGMILFFALRKLTSGLRGHTGFIYLTIYYWDDIRWEGEMLHDLSEVDLGLAISDVTDWKDYRVMPMHDFN